MGTIISIFYLRNDSGTACRTYGFPGVSATNGTNVVAVARRDSDPNGYGTARPITLAPGSNAYFTVATSDTPNGDAPCPSATRLRVFPPDDTTSLTIKHGFSVCHGWMRVGPLRLSEIA